MLGCLKLAKLFFVSVGLFFFCILFGGGCAIPLKDSKIEIKKFVSPPKPGREPGSLWTVDSKWNDLYSYSANREPGDVIFVKPTENLKEIVAKRAGRELKKVERRPGESTEATENAIIPVTIREVRGRGMYAVESSSSHLSDPPDIFTFTAYLRERDVSADDLASSDSLFNLDMKFVPMDPLRKKVVEAANAKDESEGKEEKKTEKELEETR
jgi:hypothetical protein